MIDITTAIYELYPQVVRTSGETAYDVNDNEVTYNKVAVQAYVDAHAYIDKRKAEYPPITDYLDGIVKGDTEQVQDYIDACLAVKAKYPKPE